MWGLAFNDSEGNPVDKQHNIRPGIVELVPAVHRKFLGHMEYKNAVKYATTNTPKKFWTVWKEDAPSQCISG